MDNDKYTIEISVSEGIDDELNRAVNQSAYEAQVEVSQAPPKGFLRGPADKDIPVCSTYRIGGTVKQLRRFARSMDEEHDHTSIHLLSQKIRACIREASWEPAGMVHHSEMMCCRTNEGSRLQIRKHHPDE